MLLSKFQEINFHTNGRIFIQKYLKYCSKIIYKIFYFVYKKESQLKFDGKFHVIRVEKLVKNTKTALY